MPHNKKLYVMRNIVEHFFCKMKDMRRLATRFEKKAINFLSMVQLSAIRCWLKWPTAKKLVKLTARQFAIGSHR